MKAFTTSFAQVQMEAIFDSLGKVVYSTGDHKGYIINWKFVSPFCKKWSRNREPDLKRVEEMIECHNKGVYIPRTIHLAETKEEGVVCYDGNHRRTVFDFCKGESLLCLVDVMFGATQSKIYEAFNNINKAVQVPALYLEENDSKVKDEIITLVKRYESKYKCLLSASGKCHKPNFNRDTFTDNIYEIYKRFEGVYTIHQLSDFLEKLNKEYSQERICQPHSTYKDCVLEKCKKYGLWLFLERTIPFEHVRLVSSG